MYFSSQKGIAQLAIIIFLVVGLAVALLAVKTQTNLFPKAYEVAQDNEVTNSTDEPDDFKGGTKDEFYCKDGTEWYKLYDKDGNVREEGDTGLSCSSFQCTDNKKYCDPNATQGDEKGFWVHKYINSEDPLYPNGSCKYIFDVTTEKCSVSESGQVKDNKPTVTLRPETDTEDYLVCEPDKFYYQSCSSCNSAGTAFNADDGSDWGPNNTVINKIYWCSCAARFNGKYGTKQGYNKENYPNCVVGSGTE